MGNLTHRELKTAILICKCYSNCLLHVDLQHYSLLYMVTPPRPLPQPPEISGTDCTFECEDIYNITRMLVDQQRDMWLFWLLFLLSVFSLHL